MTSNETNLLHAIMSDDLRGDSAVASPHQQPQRAYGGAPRQPNHEGNGRRTRVSNSPRRQRQHNDQRNSGKNWNYNASYIEITMPVILKLQCQLYWNYNASYIEITMPVILKLQCQLYWNYNASYIEITMPVILKLQCQLYWNYNASYIEITMPVILKLQCQLYWNYNASYIEITMPVILKLQCQLYWLQLMPVVLKLQCQLYWNCFYFCWDFERGSFSLCLLEIDIGSSDMYRVIF